MDGLEFDPLLNWDEDQESAMDNGGLNASSGAIGSGENGPCEGSSQVEPPHHLMAAAAMGGGPVFDNWQMDPVTHAVGDYLGAGRRHQPQQPQPQQQTLPQHQQVVASRRSSDDVDANILPSFYDSPKGIVRGAGSVPPTFAPTISKTNANSSSCSPPSSNMNSVAAAASGNAALDHNQNSAISSDPGGAIRKSASMSSAKTSNLSCNGAASASAPSSSAQNATTNASFTFPQSYQFNLGHTHPLAMTSLASCPPHVNVGSLHSMPPSMNANSNNNTANTASSSAPSQLAPMNAFFLYQNNNNMNHMNQFNSTGGGPSFDPVASMQHRQPLIQWSDITAPGANHSSLSQVGGLNPTLSVNNQAPSMDAANSNTTSSSSANPPRSSLDAKTQLSNAFASAMSGSINANPSNSASPAFQHSTYHPQHYGMAVNGFHPQVNAQVNPVLPMPGAGGVVGLGAMNMNDDGSGGGVLRTSNESAGCTNTSNSNNLKASRETTTTTTSTTSPLEQKSNTSSSKTAASSSKSSNGNNANLVAAASNATKTARERNEREQMRAQKITQLIHELRVNMQKGGWKQEMKSKYQTLSQCKDYMDYLKKSHKDKEADIEHTKKLIEEKALFDARSDPESIPESITSTLTASTARCNSPGSSSDKDDSSSSSHGEKKRKKISSSKDPNGPVGDGKQELKSNTYPSKKSRKSSLRDNAKGDEGPPSSTESSSEDDAGNESPGGKNISFDKTSSSVSDMTDSNRSSADGLGPGSSASKSKLSSKSQSLKRIHESMSAKGEAGDVPVTSTRDHQSTSSISSTAAVVRGLGSSQRSPGNHNHRRNHATNTSDGTKEANTGNETTVCSHKKKRRGFDYDYKEVFLKSNVPQLIATLSGRIVVWNKFFLLATGLSDREAKRQTIFSIVQSSELSSLYKMVARALSEAKDETALKSVTAASSRSSTQLSEVRESDEVSSKPQAAYGSNEEWQAVTLKCISFPSKKNSDENHHPNPLYITIALMADDDQQQRCFHCILTDCPGTNGKFGIVTPDLLAMLFSSGDKCSRSNKSKDKEMSA